VKLSDLITDFERSLKRRGLSPNTIEAYHWALHDLNRRMTLEFLFEVSDLTREVLEEWQDSQIDREWSARSRGLAVTAARQLIRYAIDQELITDPKLERSLAKVKQPEMEPHPIPEADLEIVKAYYLAKPENPSVIELRDRALFFFIFTTCGRVSEILQARVDDYWARRR
jgi:site-specific recombinase XerD